VVAALMGHDTPEVTKALLGRLNDRFFFVRAAAVVALISRDMPEVTKTLLGSLNDRSMTVRATAVAVLAVRTTPKLNQELLDEFADQAWATRLATMARRDSKEVTQALLDRLADPAPLVRMVAKEVLAAHDAPEVLMYLTRETGKLMLLADETVQVSDPPLLDRAEELMTQFYRRIEPSEQPAVLNAMGWLTRLRW
jgi:HEAT repeat protein